MKNYLVFESKNEDGINKADLIAKSPVGTKWVTRREIEQDDKCSTCGWEEKEHIDPIYSPCNNPEGKFFPAKYAIGREFFVAKRNLFAFLNEKKGENALCSCGTCKYGHIFENCKCNNFKPIILKIMGGMWHMEWCKGCDVDTPNKPEGWWENSTKMLNREGILEGFKTPEGWLEAAEENKSKWGDIRKSWRIELERIQ